MSYFDSIEFPKIDWPVFEGPKSYTLGSGSTSASQSISTSTINGSSYSVRSLTISGHGNDTIFSLTGRSTIDAGGGVDTLVLTAERAAYQVQITGAGAIVTGAATNSIDTISGVERLQFTDGTLVLDTSGNEGQAYRLYQSAFDRAPDLDGLKYWIGVLDEGNGLSYVADRFIASDEFTIRYGENVSNTAFVDALYHNILDRAGDEGGVAFWNEKLDSGEFSRTDVLIRFSESEENIVGVAPDIAGGIWLG